MKIYIASDHAGFALKAALIPSVQTLGHTIEDLGAFKLDMNDDYPDFVKPLAMRVARESESCGIVIGASGEGEAIAANRIKGIRAVVYYGTPQKNQTDAEGNILNLIQSTRAHNNANILSLGARFISEDDARETVALWLSTPFQKEERHMRRIVTLDD